MLKTRLCLKTRTKSDPRGRTMIASFVAAMIASFVETMFASFVASMQASPRGSSKRFVAQILLSDRVLDSRGLLDLHDTRRWHASRRKTFEFFIWSLAA